MVKPKLICQNPGCEEQVTHIVRGIPPNLWWGQHCKEHADIASTHYEHQGGCIVQEIKVTFQ